jgi:hypothetical protein
MPKAFVAATIGLNRGACGLAAHSRSDGKSNARPPVKSLKHVADELAYWALRSYVRVLKGIGDASELAASCKPGKDR